MKKLQYNEKANLNNIVIILRSMALECSHRDKKFIDMIIVLFKTNSFILLVIYIPNFCHLTKRVSLPSSFKYGFIFFVD